MRVLFDTSVLLAACVEPHPMHDRAWPWLRRAKAGEFEFLVASHTLAELYAVLTQLPVMPRLSPSTIRRLIRDNVEAAAKIVSLNILDYTRTITRMAELGLRGGVIYDALIARAAEKAGADRLLTLNPEDFRRVWPAGEAVLTVP